MTEKRDDVISEVIHNYTLYQKKGFKPNFKGRAGVFTNWELVPQERILTTEGFAVHSTFGNSGNHN